MFLIIPNKQWSSKEKEKSIVECLVTGDASQSKSERPLTLRGDNEFKNSPFLGWGMPGHVKYIAWVY